MDKDFEKWEDELNNLFDNKVGITPTDCGLDTLSLMDCFMNGETPQDVLEYYIRKYDLTLKEKVGI